ncbi:MAG: PIN domain-containing protein [Campylobacterota bacterium]|nr:PIN domain-containing protein [Campylobacterota bacterium]
MLYMLDTNICAFIIRNKPQYIKEKLQNVEKDNEVALSSIVVAELLFGAKKKQSQKLTKLVDTFIGNFTIYDFDKKAAVEYAKIRTELESQGKIIGANDLLIAAHAKSLSAIMVTNNTREFLRVDGLDVEDWVE